MDDLVGHVVILAEKDTQLLDGAVTVAEVESRAREGGGGMRQSAGIFRWVSFRCHRALSQGFFGMLPV